MTGGAPSQGPEAASSDPATQRIALWAYCLPFALFIALLALISFLPDPKPVPPGETDWRWIYAVRTVVVGGALILLWRWYDDLRTGPRMTLADWAASIVVGVVIFVLWIWMDHGWMVLGATDATAGFDPRRHGTEEIFWPLTVFRLVGLAVVIPLAEEIFWRSFLMRWLERPDFRAVSPAAIGMRSLAITSVLFALEHSQWLAGLIAGLAFGYLYMRTGKLWTAVIAHAVTNGLLGAWILATGQYYFW